jgi:hypothetical protein
MPRQDTAQLNIRSAFARARVAEIAAATGMTATQVIEDALRFYVPPAPPEAEAPVPEGMIRKGRLLVLAARPGQKTITQKQTNRAINAVRNRIR